jgi:hypothetical protein
MTCAPVRPSRPSIALHSRESSVLLRAASALQSSTNAEETSSTTMEVTSPKTALEIVVERVKQLLDER